METFLVRLKPFAPRRGHVLRRFTYAGIKFQEERGWGRVEKPVADYLRGVHQVPGDADTPLAFDVCTEAEAKVLEAAEAEAAKGKRSATDDLKVLQARPSGALPAEDVPKPGASPEEKDGRRGKREKE